MLGQPAPSPELEEEWDDIEPLLELAASPLAAATAAAAAEDADIEVPPWCTGLIAGFRIGCIAGGCEAIACGREGGAV